MDCGAMSTMNKNAVQNDVVKLKAALSSLLVAERLMSRRGR